MERALNDCRINRVEICIVKILKMNFGKKILKRFLLVIKLIICTFPPLWVGLGWGILLISCDDMEDKLKPSNNTGLSEPTQLYILSEGLYNMNNSTLATYNLETKSFVSDYFLAANKRSLGDTGNDMAIYGSKLYVVMNTSSRIEVIESASGKSIKQIPMFTSNNSARSPRQITFFGSYAYVCSFDGTVAKIDTTTLQLVSLVQSGKNPDGICVSNNKIYVSNSGGLNFPNFENTVSVIDLNTFTVIKKIFVGVNPGKILADSKGDVYVVSRGDYGLNPYKFQRISTITDEVVQNFDDIKSLNFTIHNDTAFIYNFDFTTQKCWVKVFDCVTEKIISENFINDGSELITPYGIDVNPSNGDVYLTDAKSYTVWGDVLCFNKNGKLKFKIRELGLNPNKVVFYGR